MAWTAPRTWVVGEIVTAAQMNTHLRDNLDALGRDSHDAANIGTAGGLGERWYYAGLRDAASFTGTTLGITAGSIYAVPFTASRGPRTADRIAYFVSTLSAGNARQGIYAAISDTDLYPSALVVDGGEISTGTTGLKSSTISAVLEPDVLYWMVLLCSATPTISAFPITAPKTLALGWQAGGFGGNIDAYIRRTQTYGALPSTFPAGPPTTFHDTVSPLFGLRFSA